jgi:hypothetical protein
MTIQVIHLKIFRKFDNKNANFQRYMEFYNKDTTHTLELFIEFMYTSGQDYS